MSWLNPTRWLRRLIGWLLILSGTGGVAGTQSGILGHAPVVTGPLAGLVVVVGVLFVASAYIRIDRPVRHRRAHDLGREVAMDGGDEVSAESMLKRALELGRRIGATDKIDVTNRAMLRLYVQGGRYAEAVPLSEQMLSPTTTQHRAIRETVRLMNEHIELLKKVGRPDEVARFERRVTTLETMSQGTVESAR